MCIFCIYLYSQEIGGIFQDYTNSPYLPHEVIITYHPWISEDKKRDFEDEYGLLEKLVCERKGWISYDTDGTEDIERLIDNLRKHPYVRDIQPNFILSLSWTPNDPYFLIYQWHLRRISMEDAWDIEQGGDSTIIIGVLDSGVAFEDYPVPPYEQGKIDSSTTMYLKLSDYSNAHFISGFDFVNNDDHPNDNHSHGTHVASTIIESTNNGNDLAGIAFNVTMIPVKVVNWLGFGGVDECALGIYFAVDHGVDILNISLAASSNPGPVLEDAIEYADQNGVIMVAGAGNSGQGYVSYPAQYEEVIAVSATNSANPDSLAYYSNYGTGIDLSAPGGDLVDRDNNGFPDLVVQQTILPGIFNGGLAKPDSFVMIGYGGTSMATPHVSGTIALMLSYGIPPENIRDVLYQTSVDCGDPGYDTLFGYGRIDCFRALGGSDTIPPDISGTTILEDTYFTGPFAVWSDIYDLFGIKDARIWYKVNTDDWMSAPYVDRIFPNKYLFYIPEVTPPAVIKYYIEATDNPQNSATDPENAPQYYYSFIVEELGVEEREGDKRSSITIPSFLSEENLPITLTTPLSKRFSVSVYDISGKMIKEESFFKPSRKEYSIHIPHLSNGIYFVKITCGKFTITKKFITIR
jgi:subtilisin family serine protease